MRQTIRLTESQLRSMIEESVAQILSEGDVDEVNLKGLRNMFSRFGSDAKNVATTVGGAIGDAGKAVGNAVVDAGKAVGKAGKAAVGAVGDAGRSVGKYAQELGNEYKAGSSEDQVNKISAQLDKWFQNGVFGQDKKGYIQGAITRLKDALKLAHNANYQNHSMDMGDDYNQRQQRSQRRRKTQPSTMQQTA